MPTAADYQRLIVAEVGRALPAGTPDADGLEANIGTLWAMYGDKAQVAPRLQYLYAKREALEFVIGALARKQDVSLGPLSVKQTQTVATLERMLTRVDAAIVAALKQAAGRRGAAVGVITATEPVPPPSDQVDAPDASDPYYQGSPYAPRVPWNWP